TLADLLKADKIPRANRGDVLAVLAGAGTTAERALALEKTLTEPDLGPSERIRILEALESSASALPLPTGADLNRLAALFDHADAPLAAAALRLAGTWKVRNLRPQIEQIAADPGVAATRRRSAVRALVNLGEPDTKRRLHALAAADVPYPVRADAIAGLAALDLPRAAEMAVPLLRLSVSS